MASSPVNGAAKAICRALSVTPPNHALYKSMQSLSNPLTFLASHTSLDQSLWLSSLDDLAQFASHVFNTLNATTYNANPQDRTKQLQLLHEHAMSLLRRLDLIGFQTAFFPFHLHLRTQVNISSVIDIRTDISSQLQKILQSLPAAYACLDYIFHSEISSSLPTTTFRHIISTHQFPSPPSPSALAPIPTSDRFVKLEALYRSFIQRLSVQQFNHDIKGIRTFVNSLWLQPEIDVNYMRLENTDSDLGLAPRLGTSANTCVEPALLALMHGKQHLWTTRIVLKSICNPTVSPVKEALFRQETLRLHLFSHPCIPVMYGSVWPNLTSSASTDAVIATERMTHSLRNAVSLTPLKCFEVRLRILVDVADALQYLHMHQVLHGAVCPENVHLRIHEKKVHGRAKVDLTALAVRAISSTICKRPHIYNPPEYVAARQQMHFTADVWSFAVLACFLFAGQDSSYEDNVRFVNAVATHGKCYLAKEWAAKIANQPLRQLVNQCLIEDPSRRLTALQVFEDLRKLHEMKTVEPDTAPDLGPTPHINHVEQVSTLGIEHANGSMNTPPRHSETTAAAPSRESFDFDDYSKKKPLANGTMHEKPMENGVGSSQSNSTEKGMNENATTPRHRFSLRRTHTADPIISPDPSHPLTLCAPGKDATENGHRTDTNLPPEAVSDDQEVSEDGAGSSTEKPKKDFLKSTMEEIFGPVSSSKKNLVKKESVPKIEATLDKASLDDENGMDPPSADDVLASKQTNSSKGNQTKQENGIDEITPNHRVTLRDRNNSTSELDTDDRRGGLGKRRTRFPSNDSDFDDPIRPSTRKRRKSSSVWDGRIRDRRSRVTPTSYVEAGETKSMFSASSDEEQLSMSSRPPESHSSILSMGTELSKSSPKSKKRGPRPKNNVQIYEDEKEHNRLRATIWTGNANSLRQGSSQRIDLSDYKQNGRPGESAIDYYRRESLNGNANAQVKLGIMFEEGISVTQDYVQACFYYEQAAVGGNCTGQTRLAHCYQAGRGVTANQPLAAILFKKAAGNGDMESQVLSGQCYEEGRGVKQDIETAIEYYRMAALKNSPDAKYCLGRLHEEGKGLEKSPTEAFYYFQQAAKNGHVPSIVKCARFYARGMGGVKRSLTKAVELYRRGSAAGHPDAMLSLGLLHEDGHGVKKSSEIALRLYRNAAKTGYAPAETALGQCYSWGYGVEHDARKAVELFRTAAAKGNVLAHHELGMCFKDGHGVEKNYPEAAKYFQKAIEKGSAVSYVHFGEMLYSGLGVKRDFKKAFEHFKTASSLGAAEGYRWLGDCYVDGTGCKIDVQCGVEMYRKAAQMGSHEAKNTLGCCYENGNGVEKNYAKALSWYRKAATDGNHTATNNLGIFYEQGLHVKQDFKRAFTYYQKAMKLGSVEAICNLADCHKSGNGTPRNLKKAVELYRQAANEGSGSAMCELGICYSEGNGVNRNFEKAVELFLEASKSEPEALRQLGMAYYDGRGVKKNFQKGIEFFESALKAENNDACVNLALCHASGCGVQRSMKRAIKFYEEGVQRGCKSAMLLLGNCYFKGVGVEQDYKRARELFEQGEDDNLLPNYNLRTVSDDLPE